MPMSEPVIAMPNELRKVWNDHLEAKQACREWASNNNVWLSTTHSTINGEKRKIRFACKHYGEPRNQEVYDDSKAPVTTVKTFTSSNDGQVTETINKKAKRRNKDSQRIGCPFSITLRPLSRDSQQWRVVSFYNGGHNHELALENSTYPGFRDIGDDHDIVLSMIKGHATNPAIIKFLAGRNKVVDAKDITRLRQMVFNNDPDHKMYKFISRLQEKEYEVRWLSVQEGEKNFLRSVFFAHKSAIALARNFPEAIIMDATYKTNKHRMPFVNVVGTSNIGYPALKTFSIAGGWLSEENNETYEWFTTCLKDIVWPSSQSSSPEVFVTDNENKLTRALDIVFPQATKLLCQIHIRRNFRTKLQKLFEVKGDYEELEKAINLLMMDEYNDTITKMRMVPDTAIEVKALKMYEVAAKKAKMPEEVNSYLAL